MQEKEMVVNELSSLIAECLEDILQFRFENSNTDLRYVVYNILERFLFALIRRNPIGCAF